jgi:SAM-dependent methyltransferase
MFLYNKFHTRCILPKRCRIIARAIADILPEKENGFSLLDVGSREGKVTRSIYKLRKEKFFEVQTADICDTQNSGFKHTVFDGKKLPFPSDRFDIVSFIDVLHHAEDMGSLLYEAKRVTRKYIIIKDHRYSKKWELESLKIQDRFGNAATDCPLPFNFLTDNGWREIFDGLELTVVRAECGINFNHPFPFNMLYPNRLHFISLVSKK